MDENLKILLSIESHISCTLTKMKLEKFGHVVIEEKELSSLSAEVKNHFYDVVLVEASIDITNDVCHELNSQNKPVIFVETDKGLSANSDMKLTLKSSFSEEDFLHRYHYAQELLEKQKEPEVCLKQKILDHYAGDEELVSKVCRAFLDGYKSHLEIITNAFLHDNESVLVKKIHAFKGVLSALGETPAAKLIKKIEILVRGRQTKAAATFLAELSKECHSLADDVEHFTQ